MEFLGGVNIFPCGVHYDLQARPGPESKRWIGRVRFPQEARFSRRKFIGDKPVFGLTHHN